MITDSGIELLAAAVIGQAFRDLGHANKDIRASANRFFQDKLYEAWRNRDLMRFYEMYLEDIANRPPKEPKPKTNIELRELMFKYPRVTMTAVGEACGLSQTKIIKKFSKPLSFELTEAFKIIIEAIREGKR